MKIKRRLIIVHWLDIVHGYYDGWCDAKKKAKNFKPALMRSVGWLVKEKKTHLTLCQNLCKDGDGFSLVTIPRGCITNIRRLK